MKLIDPACGYLEVPKDFSDCSHVVLLVDGWEEVHTMHGVFDLIQRFISTEPRQYVLVGLGV
jgi:hypothetical protein